MRLRAKKDEGKVDPELRYSFMSRHVKRARTETHLIALAFFEPLVTKDGDLRTDKDSTQRIYSQPELLRRTLVALLQGADENSLRHMMEVT
jgi:hypothetical protein